MQIQWSRNSTKCKPLILHLVTKYAEGEIALTGWQLCILGNRAIDFHKLPLQNAQSLMQTLLAVVQMCITKIFQKGELLS